MLHRVAVVLLLLWLLGRITAYTLGGLIHMLLFGAIAAFLLEFAQSGAGFTRRH